VRLGKKKLYSLAYADIVLMAEDEEGLRSMLESLKTYLYRKERELNKKKTSDEV